MRVRLLPLLMLLVVSAATARADGELAWLQASDAHGRPLDLSRLRGQVVAVTFCSRFTQHEVGDVNDRLQAAARSAGATVVSVIDFDGIPRMFHGYARRRVLESERPGGVTHLIDDQSRLRDKFGADPRRRVDIVVLDRSGTVRGRFVGRHQVEDAVRLMNELGRARM